ncbi:MAG TPA: hypothetical protein DCW68_05270 [Rhodospirillaceae bacterium]|nr:MAG: hypothetical protein A2018_02380 [Alphaproteobacteria bacterium GWF2_58_20]HAU29505.1 hypothetical protein [Rhodospirillaceae bacterium]
MSNLIVSVIAIALVAAMVLAATYYGGSVFNSYQAEARASKLLNEAEQIVGTVAYYRVVKNEFPTSLEQMAVIDPATNDSFLSDVPEGGKYDPSLGTVWKFVGDYVMTAIGQGSRPATECLAARRRLGYDAERYCANSAAAAAYCSGGVGVEGDTCSETDSKHCLHYCFEPADDEPRDQANTSSPFFNTHDPCCVDNEMGGPSSDEPIYLE